MTIDPGLFEESERPSLALGVKRVSIGAFQCELGGQLPEVEVGYQTWGEFRGDNAVLVCHAISGDSSVDAWWPRMFGAGCALDPSRDFIVCSNVLGGCQGTTGPRSPAPDGRSWGSRFPRVTIGDMVRAQAQLADRLGVRRWRLVCGGSMGGMQALEWGASFPERVEAVWCTASAAAHSAMQIGFNEVARQAIERDPKWAGGEYAPDDPPTDGLAVARMIGHLTYLSREAFDLKFGRREQGPPFERPSEVPPFEVENYLHYQGRRFTERFDANSLLVISRAIDRYECSVFSPSVRYLFTSFTSDWLYPPEQSEAAGSRARAAGAETSWVNLESALGHDAFLLEADAQLTALRDFGLR